MSERVDSPAWRRDALMLALGVTAPVAAVTLLQLVLAVDRLPVIDDTLAGVGLNRWTSSRTAPRRRCAPWSPRSPTR